MCKRLMLLVLALVMVAMFAACAPTSPPATDNAAPQPEPAPTEPAPPAAGSGLAPGLYDIEGGQAQAIGELRWIDLEGGFWAVVDTTAAGDGKNVAVIANGAEITQMLEPLEGMHVSVIGERFEGASIRMAGPEIIAESVEEFSPGGGPAQ
ncbi:MAG: hypothetical protein M1617_07790 [Actinobacteria bacterium]|nr:hypothetical protein [Actinomycetota bacterium]